MHKNDRNIHCLFKYEILLLLLLYQID